MQRALPSVFFNDQGFVRSSFAFAIFSGALRQLRNDALKTAFGKGYQCNFFMKTRKQKNRRGACYFPSRRRFVLIFFAYRIVKLIKTYKFR